MLSTAMAHVGAHRRLALAMVRTVGGGGKRLILGFMLATAVCSMWISNTATTLMMLPVALAIVGNNGPQTQGHAGKGEDAGHPLAVPLLLGIAYAASIGGMGTPVGTPPNVIFMGIYREATGVDVGFLDWMLIGLPVVVLMLPVAWLWVTRGVSSDEDVSLPEQGQWSTAERRVMAVFVVTALAWMTRTAPFGGWSSALDVPGVGDSTVALAAVIAMFLIPSGQGERLLNWETASRIPWGLLLLFGGGIAIARAFESSGLSVSLGTWLADDVGIVGWPLLGMLAALCLGVTFLTEVTSNTATTTLLMPVLAATGVAAGVDPILLMVPATLSASCAFMLPVATAPNAIVFGTDKVSIRQMAKMGFGLNLMGAALLVGVCSLIL